MESQSVYWMKPNNPLIVAITLPNSPYQFSNCYQTNSVLPTDQVRYVKVNQTTTPTNLIPTNFAYCPQNLNCGGQLGYQQPPQPCATGCSSFQSSCVDIGTQCATTMPFRDSSNGCMIQFSSVQGEKHGACSVSGVHACQTVTQCSNFCDINCHSFTAPNLIDETLRASSIILPKSSEQTQNMSDGRLSQNQQEIGYEVFGGNGPHGSTIEKTDVSQSQANVATCTTSTPCESIRQTQNILDELSSSQSFGQTEGSSQDVTSHAPLFEGMSVINATAIESGLIQECSAIEQIEQRQTSDYHQRDRFLHESSNAMQSTAPDIRPVIDKDITTETPDEIICPTEVNSSDVVAEHYQTNSDGEVKSSNRNGEQEDTSTKPKGKKLNKHFKKKVMFRKKISRPKRDIAIIKDRETDIQNKNKRQSDIGTERDGSEIEENTECKDFNIIEEHTRKCADDGDCESTDSIPSSKDSEATAPPAPEETRSPKILSVHHVKEIREVKSDVIDLTSEDDDVIFISDDKFKESKSNAANGFKKDGCEGFLKEKCAMDVKNIYISDFEFRETTLLKANLATIAWHPYCDILATGIDAGRISIFQLKSASCKRIVDLNFIPSINEIESPCVAWMPDGNPLELSIGTDTGKILLGYRTCFKVQGEVPGPVSRLLWQPKTLGSTNSNHLLALSGRESELTLFSYSGRDSTAQRIKNSALKIKKTFKVSKIRGTSVNSRTIAWQAGSLSRYFAFVDGNDVKACSTDGVDLTLHGHTSPPLCLAWRPTVQTHMLCAAASDGCIKIWNVCEREKGICPPVITFSENKGIADSIHWVDGTSSLATGCSDGVVRIWDVERGRCSRRYSISGVPTSAVTCFDFKSFDQSLMAVGYSSGIVNIWDVRRPSKPALTYNKFSQDVPINCIKWNFSIDNRILAMSSKSLGVRLLDLRNLRSLTLDADVERQ